MYGWQSRDRIFRCDIRSPRSAYRRNKVPLAASIQARLRPLGFFLLVFLEGNCTFRAALRSPCATTGSTPCHKRDDSNNRADKQVRECRNVIAYERRNVASLWVTALAVT
jgi:hypothetical protein